jgi:ketosteroid isomerase-like protein
LFIEVVPETWSNLTAEPEEYIKAADQILVIVRNVGRGRSSGVKVDRRAAHVCRVHGGKIEAIHAYPDIAAGFEAAGLPPP